MRGKQADYTGLVFNRWTILKHIGGVKWLCRCSCPAATERVQNVHQVIGGYTNSCGCHRDEVTKRLFTKHGASSTKAHHVWKAMKQRCYNPNYKQFKDYGGRGITVCDEWRDSFATFYRDMGDPPPGLTIERQNNNAGYSKDNCVWATRAAQVANRREQARTSHITFNEETMTPKQWADRLGIKLATIHFRMRRNFPADEILAKDLYRHRALKLMA